MSDTAEALTRPATSVPILGEHHILADALHRILPHIRKAEKGLPPAMMQHLIIEPDGTLAATNGATIAAYRWAVTPAPGVRVLLELPDADSQSMMKRLAKKASKEDPLFGVRIMPNGQTMTVSVGRESLTVTPSVHAEDYPNWRKLFTEIRQKPSRSEPTAILGLYPDKLALFGNGSVQLTFGGPADAIIVRYGYEQNFWGAVMPARIDTYAEPFPAWCVEDDFTPKPESEASE